MRKVFVVSSAAVLIFILAVSVFWTPILWTLLVVIPLISVGVSDMLQTQQTIKRNYPLVGRGRYIMEDLRPKIYQYFVESDINGRPFNRVNRSVVYQRAKRDLDTTPFGTQLDVYEVGYEWLNHSLNPLHLEDLDNHPRVSIGSGCAKPYSASLLNISAMSFGSLSANAVLALNGGARIGGFAHNTGEGGLSPYHLQPGGDLVWQIGTGYFGCRTLAGEFDEEMFKSNASHESVRMIEVKLSQGAKPGHGGILPAVKNTPEIAKIRGVEPHTKVLSPPAHSAFSTPRGLLEFVARLREASGGKPVGFKLCVGRPVDFIAICKAMIASGIAPDYITVDGGEGGTGAAPLEFSNAVGTPLKEGLVFVDDMLRGFGLRDKIKICASGKIVTGFDIVRTLALGADYCNSARGMMLALGCIQALECNSNSCPTGITTHNPQLTVGLVPKEKEQRVAHFHHETVESAVELLAAAGVKTPDAVNRSQILRRISYTDIRNFEELYPTVPTGALLTRDCPPNFQLMLDSASPDHFA
ncbi:MAG: FMN-binding glutamate synthase family protein [Bdellovibrionales bacterium]|nr:FMN-binding glutamate synthase family protein [Bdellovibrionales bacterium]